MSIFNDPAQYKRLTSSSADHVRRYRASEGQDGHINANGLRHLLLTTVGRKSGMERTTPLIYGREGERFIIVGSVGGADQHPRWFVNLVEHPEVHVQVGPGTLRSDGPSGDGRGETAPLEAHGGNLPAVR